MDVEYVKDSFEEYLGKKDHISASDVKNFLKSPKYYHYRKYEEKKVDSKEKKHFTIGSALHEIILEPHKFNKHYAVSEKFDLRTAKGKKQLAMFQKKHKGKKLLVEDDMDMITQIGKNALSNHTLVELIKDTYRELSIYTVDQKTKLQIRLRPDIYSKNKSTITDIKSCLESSPKAFKGDVYKFGYSITNSFYKDFSKKENYVFCALEKNAPYQVSLFVLPDEMEQYGRKNYRMALDLMKWCYDNQYWPDYNEFEILKECYELENLDKFFDLNQTASRITILK